MSGGAFEYVQKGADFRPSARTHNALVDLLRTEPRLLPQELDPVSQLRQQASVVVRAKNETAGTRNVHDIVRIGYTVPADMGFLRDLQANEILGDTHFRARPPVRGEAWGVVIRGGVVNAILDVVVRGFVWMRLHIDYADQHYVDISDDDYDRGWAQYTGTAAGVRYAWPGYDLGGGTFLALVELGLPVRMVLGRALELITKDAPGQVRTWVGAGPVLAPTSEYFYAYHDWIARDLDIPIDTRVICSPFTVVEEVEGLWTERFIWRITDADC